MVGAVLFHGLLRFLLGPFMGIALSELVLVEVCQVACLNDSLDRGELVGRYVKMTSAADTCGSGV